jgi:hypothetical protein
MIDWFADDSNTHTTLAAQLPVAALNCGIMTLK